MLFITGQGHIIEITRYLSYSEESQHKGILVMMFLSIAVAKLGQVPGDWKLVQLDI